MLSTNIIEDVYQSAQVVVPCGQHCCQLVIGDYCYPVIDIDVDSIQDSCYIILEEGDSLIYFFFNCNCVSKNATTIQNMYDACTMHVAYSKIEPRIPMANSFHIPLYKYTVVFR